MSSIREVAKRAGVAACTVSRLLNGTATVAPETKNRIEQAMRELDYIPNELARGMFRQKAGIIGMMVPSIKHPFFSSLAENIEQYLYEKGYKLLLCSTSDEVKKEKEYLQFLKSNIVDGVIMAVNNLEKKAYETYNKPIIMLDYFVNDHTPIVVSDHKMGGRLAAKEFIKSGCKYVIHLCSEIQSSNVVSYDSHVELEKTLKEHGIACRKVEIKWNEFDFAGYEELAKTIFEYYPEVDGIMAADMPAIAFLNAGIKLQRKIPEELRVIAYDGTYAVEMNEKKLTMIVQPIDDIAKKVVDIMIDKIDGIGETKINFSLPVKLVKGETT